MTETTSTTTNEDTRAAWAAAAAASEEANKPKDPPPRRFIERLPVALSDRERLQLAVKFTDACKQVNVAKEDLKAYVSEKKAEIKKQEALAEEYGDSVRTGRVTKDVECEERVSFAQNRKYTVRLDTGEELKEKEKPLSDSDRQVLLMPDDREDGQLTLADIGSSDLDEESIPPPDFDENDDEEDDGTAVTDPEALLEDAERGADGTGSEPPAKPSRKGKK